MNASDLRRYASFYTTSAYMGANVIFRAYFGLDSGHPVPLSLSHGVDYGHCHYPQDVKALEPIHWSYNEHLHRAALAYKPSLLLPHPWAMLTSAANVPEGSGTLLIGPPPGPVNDERLFRLVDGSLEGEVAILVKARGAYEESLRYWRDRGITPVTAGPPDEGFYPRLAQLLGPYRRVVGGTFSGALVFAASIGREVRLLRGFVHRTLEGRDYETEVDWAAPRARAVVAAFCEGDQPTIRRVARSILGADLEIDRAAKIDEMNRIIAGLDSPFWMNPEVWFPPPLMRRRLASWFSKPGLMNAGLGNYLDRLRRRELAVMTVDEIDVWLNGRSPSNFDLRPIVEGREQAAAGLAAERYEQ